VGIRSLRQTISGYTGWFRSLTKFVIQLTLHLHPHNCGFKKSLCRTAGNMYCWLHHKFCWARFTRESPCTYVNTKWCIKFRLIMLIMYVNHKINFRTVVILKSIGCSFKCILKVLSVCKVKTQTTQKVRLYLNSWSVICGPWCVHN
jgi:hypothetical protein